VVQANQLIKYCDGKLRGIEAEVNEKSKG
jgi:hypothetical protein